MDPSIIIGNVFVVPIGTYVCCTYRYNKHIFIMDNNQVGRFGCYLPT